MRDTSSRSCTSLAWACALRSMRSMACRRSSSGRWPVRSRCTQPTMALSGVRSSCERVARNSSFSRLASCSRSSRSARSRCERFDLVEHAIEGLDQHADLVLRGAAWRESSSRRDRQSRARCRPARRSAAPQSAAARTTAGRRAAGRRRESRRPRRPGFAAAQAERVEIAHEQDLAAGVAPARQLLDHFEPVRRKARARRDRRRARSLGRRRSRSAPR